MKNPRTKRKQVGSKELAFKNRAVRISRHEHTGKRLAYNYTSYSILFFLITLVALLLFFARMQIAQATVQTQSGSVQLSGMVLGPPPSTAATIDSPSDQEHFHTPIITVSGDCTPGLVVEIYRNNILAGSAFCDASSRYSISITLIPGKNTLKARIRDAFSQYGPDSASILVFYEGPLSNGSEGGGPGSPPQLNNKIPPLLLYTNSVQPGVFGGDDIIVNYQIIGGVSPYAVAVDWGDGSKVGLQSVTKAGHYRVGHQYKKGGQYVVILSATDTRGSQAVVQTIAIVNIGPSGYEPVASMTCSATNPQSSTCVIQNIIISNIDKLWPALAGATVMTACFWLGGHITYARSLKPRRLY